MTDLMLGSYAESAVPFVKTGAKILIVEDEWLVAQGLKENLIDMGHEVVGLAAFGEQALQLAEALHPELVLMDIMLKGNQDGIEVAERLRRQFELPVIFLTAYADSQTLERAKIVEPFGYILKPFEVRELRSAIEIALYKSQAEKRLQHLNQVLRAIRSISQLIVQEKDRESLIQRACQILTQGRGYFCAWIALVDGEGQVTAAAATRDDENLTQALSLLQQGKIPPCGRQVLEQKVLLVVEDLAANCGDCFWWTNHEGRGALLISLNHQTVDYGVLGVQLPALLTQVEEEMVLFRELAADLSFALYKMDLENREQQTLSALRASEAKYRQIVETANEGIWGVDREIRTIYVNRLMAEMLGYPPEEIMGRPVKDFLFPEDLAGHQEKIDRRQRGAYEQRFRRKDGSELWTIVSVRALKGESGEFQGSFAMLTDITERKQAEEALVRAKDEWELTFDAVPDMIAILDNDRTIVNLNRAMATILGTTKEEARGRKCFEMVHGLSSPPTFCPFGQLLEDGQPHSVEVFEERLEGFLQVSVSPLVDREENLLGCVHIVRDITERKTAEGAAREQFLFLETLIDTIPSPIFYMDVAGRYLGCNRAFEKYLGIPRENIVGHTAHELPSVCLANGCHEGDLDLFRHSGEQVHEASVRYADGSLHEVISYKASFPKADGNIGGLVGVMLDITQRKQTEEDLRRAHKEIEQLFRSIPFIMIGLSPDGRILQWNPEAEKALWHGDRPTTGEKLADYDLGWEWDKVLHGIEQCRETDSPVRTEDIRYQRPDGKDGFLGLTFSPMRGELDRIGLILLGRDITEQRLLEAQLTQAQKLESIGQLAAGIAHEINTPIQYVGDNTRFLKDALQDLWGLIEEYGQALLAVEGGAGVQEVKASLAEIEERVDLEYLMTEIPQAIEQSQDGVERVARIVRAMKDFSHPGSGEKTAVNINQAIENTVMVARNEWKYVAEMNTDLDPTLPLVSCLPDELNQVLLNLIINAAHAIGEVVGGNGEKGAISLSTHRDGDWVEIRVKDTGTGIPEKVRSKIFDPFFTTKQVGKGTGQGLAIAYSVVVDKHGGTISFDTEVGQGTTFILRLPLEIPGV